MRKYLFLSAFFLLLGFITKAQDKGVLYYKVTTLGIQNVKSGATPTGKFSNFKQTVYLSKGYPAHVIVSDQTGKKVRYEVTYASDLYKDDEDVSFYYWSGKQKKFVVKIGDGLFSLWEVVGNAKVFYKIDSIEDDFKI